MELRLVNWKHAENGSEELDNGAVQQRDRRNKSDRQREDSQAIDVAGLVCDKTPDIAFHENWGSQHRIKSWAATARREG
jgi:hypothetical protein